MKNKKCEDCISGFDIGDFAVYFIKISEDFKDNGVRCSDHQFKYCPECGHKIERNTND